MRLNSANHALKGVRYARVILIAEFVSGQVIITIYKLMEPHVQVTAKRGRWVSSLQRLDSVYLARKIAKPAMPWLAALFAMKDISLRIKNVNCVLQIVKTVESQLV